MFEIRAKNYNEAFTKLKEKYPEMKFRVSKEKGNLYKAIKLE